MDLEAQLAELATIGSVTITRSSPGVFSCMFRARGGVGPRVYCASERSLELVVKKAHSSVLETACRQLSDELGALSGVDAPPI